MRGWADRHPPGGGWPGWGECELSKRASEHPGRAESEEGRGGKELCRVTQAVFMKSEGRVNMDKQTNKSTRSFSWSVPPDNSIATRRRTQLSTATATATSTRKNDVLVLPTAVRRPPPDQKRFVRGAFLSKTQQQHRGHTTGSTYSTFAIYSAPRTLRLSLPTLDPAKAPSAP